MTGNVFYIDKYAYYLLQKKNCASIMFLQNILVLRLFFFSAVGT